MLPRHIQEKKVQEKGESIAASGQPFDDTCEVPSQEEVIAFGAKHPQGPIPKILCVRFWEYHDEYRLWFNRFNRLVKWQSTLLRWHLNPKEQRASGQKKSVAPDYSNPGWGTQTPYVPPKTTK